MFSITEKDLHNSPFVRFYMQEDVFNLEGSGNGNAELPFNQIIN